MATRSSILAWKIPWTEKPGGLQSMGLAALKPTTAQPQMSFLELVALVDLSMSCHPGDLRSQCGGSLRVIGKFR